MTEIYWMSSLFILVILFIILIKVCTNIKWDKSKKPCIRFIVAVGLYVISDALFVTSFLSTQNSVTAFQIIVFLFYLIYAFVPYMWYLFMHSYIGSYDHTCIHKLEWIPAFLLLGMVIISVPTGLVWSIDGEGVYIRGRLFSVFAVLNLTYYVASFVRTLYILLGKKKERPKYPLQSAAFSAIPLIGILVNTYVIPVNVVAPFQPYCLTVSTLLAYLFLVERQRNELESAHREKLYQALEQEKQASQKAREAGAVKTTFLANMSHDIRTPMNAILGFAEIIAKDPEDGQLVKDAVAKIQASGDILLHIINDVLDLSKIESGALHNTEIAADLNQITEKLKVMFEFSMKEAGIHFEIQRQIQNPYIWCDETKLQQILVNVLSNARKFTPEGGKVLFRVVQGAVTDGKAEYHFTVEDTGIGMNEEFQKHAFEAFERERTSTESKAEGTGLGLAIVKRLTDFMEGHVEIQSARGKGTKVLFTFEFRFADKTELMGNKDEVIPEVDLSGTRALLAEDNALNAEIATTLLAELGIQVEHAENGKICVKKVQETDGGYYDFILMDIQMPHMNGYEATKAIRQLEDNAKSNIPIIAMTANAFDEDRQHALEAGMNGFVSKPFRTSELISAIANAVAGKK